MQNWSHVTEWKCHLSWNRQSQKNACFENSIFWQEGKEEEQKRSLTLNLCKQLYFKHMGEHGWIKSFFYLHSNRWDFSVIMLISFTSKTIENFMTLTLEGFIFPLIFQEPNLLNFPIDIGYSCLGWLKDQGKNWFFGDGTELLSVLYKYRTKPASNSTYRNLTCVLFRLSDSQKNKWHSG